MTQLRIFRYPGGITRLVMVGLAAFLLAGCSLVKPGSEPATTPAETDRPIESAGIDLVSTPLDTVEIVVPEVEPVVALATGPEGHASLEDLEALFDTALGLAADQQTDLAQDHLFVLMDQVEMPLPADADSLYVAHRLSLSRRGWMLGGVLAEQAAFAGDPAEADSLLTTGYGALAETAFPDSLVPATGTTLPSITADLLKMDNQKVRKWEDYYTGRGRRSFQFWLDRASEVDSLVTTILEDEGLPGELLYLAMIESGLSTRAVSNASAVGPWQFMSGTAKQYGLKNDWWVDERRDMEMSTRAAARYLKDLHNRFGDWALVLAAYNTGGGRIARKIRLHGHDDFWNLRLPAQTTEHIPKYIAAARLGEDPEKYGFETGARPRLAYDIVPVDDATDLGLIARCAGVSTEELRELNPALLRGASPPDVRDYPVRVPRGTGAKARKALAKVPADKRLTWRRHRVERGETLSHIARRYGTSVNDIARLNKLNDVGLIRPGDQLVIPMPAELASKARGRADEKGHYVPPAGYERVSYKVKSGDTLGGIARKLGVTLAHLRKVNNIHRTSTIYPGQRLYAYRPGG